MLFVKKFNGIRFIFSILLVISVSFVSCQRSSKPAVATIDGKPVSMNFFLSTTTGQFRDLDRNKQNQELTDFYRTLLRAHDARQQGFVDQNDSLKYKLLATRQQILLKAVYQSFVIDSVITDAMIREAYDNMDEKRQIRHILITDSQSSHPNKKRTPGEALDLANKIKQDIESGKISFKDAAKKYSEGPSAPKGGDLGMVVWGQMVDPFQQAAWKLPLNTLSNPVQTRFGYHLIEVTKIDTLRQRPFDQEKERIARTLQRSKRMEISHRAKNSLDKINSEMGFAVTDSVLNPLLKKIGSIYAKESKTTKNPELPTILDQVNYTPIGTIQNKDITRDQFREFLGVTQSNGRGSYDNTNMFHRLLYNDMQQWVIAQFGLQHNLDHYKDTQDQIRWQEDQILSRFYMQKIVLKNFPPGDDSLRAFYARVKTARYSKPGDVNVQEIYFDNPDTARAVRKQLDNGGDFSALATRYTKRATAKDTSGYLGWFKTNRYGAIGQKAAEMTPGQIEGPFTVGTGWSIIKLIDKKPGESKSFESIKNTVKQDYIDTYRPQLIEKNIKQLEEKYHSELHYQALDSIS